MNKAVVVFSGGQDSTTCLFWAHTPLMHIDEAQTFEMVDKYGKLEYIREKTLTCYNGIIVDGCKECPACMLRNNGLEKYLKEKNRG